MNLDLQFVLEWADECGGPETEEHTHSLKFIATSYAQHEQWCSILQAFVPSVIVPGPAEDSDFESESEEEPAELLMSGKCAFSLKKSCAYNWPVDGEDIFEGRRRTNPKPWSLIGRKGPRSETSSFIQQAQFEDNEFVLSPGLLPTLFDPGTGTVLADLRTLSPLPSPRSALSPRKFHVDVPDCLSDLTGQVLRSKPYPEAHGGNADASIHKCP